MPHFEFSALTLLLVQIAIIVLVSRGLGMATRWLGQPLVIAEILAGIVLGPSLLGWLWPDALRALFPPSSMPILTMLSQIGLILFMFLIGLELDPKLLKGRTHTSVVISHVSIIVPFALGTAAAWWLHETYSSPDVPFLSFALFLGVSMSVTAFPVLARILSERHLLNSRVGAITIACAAVDDVTAWCLLAFVVAVARSGGISDALWTTALAVSFILGMVYILRPFLRRLGARVASREGLTPTVVAIVLVILVASSIATELIGIHALFGAFLFGAILPKEGKLAESLVEKLETVAVLLLLPLFFAYSGLRTQIGLVNHPDLWMVTAALIVVATVGKFGGSAVAAKLTGLRWREASALGILMNTRGLMELIVLNIGLDLGVISPTMFTMLVIMALVTTFLTTPVLRWVYPDRELARDRLVEPAEIQIGEPLPFSLVMCVSDQTAGPGLARIAAAVMGKRDQPARLYALHCRQPSGRPSKEQSNADLNLDTNPLAPLLSAARDLMLEVRPLSFVSSDPGKDICRTADAMHASMILVGAHKPLFLEGTLGGTVRDVVQNSKLPVGVFIDRGIRKVSKVILAYAGEPEDLVALEVAKQLAKTAGIHLTIMHVVAPGGAARAGRGRAQIEEIFSESGADTGAIRVLLVEHSSPSRAVLDEIKQGYDLLVVGMRPKWGLEGSLLSLKRKRVLAESSVSILAVHPPRGSMPDAIPDEQNVPNVAGSPAVSI